MTRIPDPPSRAPTSRRAVLGALAGLAAGGSGCLQRARSVFNRSGRDPISLSIKTVPTDSDPRSILIARFLAEKLDAVGIEANIVPMRPEELLRDVLVNRRFDLYVARHPGHRDPDYLRPFLHSQFGSEPGWQNPFGYANLQVDDLLVEQRRQFGERRVQTLRKLQRTVVTDCPFAVVAFPDDIRAVRTDRVAGWTDHGLHTPLSYLQVHGREGSTATETPGAGGNDTAETTPGSGASDGPSPRADELRMTLTDARGTKNLNPLSVEFRDGGALTGLLYDPLARWVGGRLEPWLAESWRWIEEPGGEGPVAEVTLRDGLEWHDGESLTASDVAFTYEFLADTSLGEMEITVPAPRFRGRSSLVTDARPRGDGTVALEFRPSSREVAALALTVPTLPAHVWRERSAPATVANLGEGSVTEALVWENMDPVGSGPLRYERSTVNERLVLAPFEEHFLEDGDLEGATEAFAGGFSFDRLRFLVVPSGEAAVEMLLSGDADGTAGSVMPQNVPPVGAAADARLQVERSSAFYHVGFNVRSAPLSNARFRRAVAALLDKEYLAREVLENYATPATSPLAGYEALSPVLAWDGEDAELPFPGEAGDLDVEAAREPFLEAGYGYREEGEVLVS